MSAANFLESLCEHAARFLGTGQYLRAIPGTGKFPGAIYLTIFILFMYVHVRLFVDNTT